MESTHFELRAVEPGDLAVFFEDQRDPDAFRIANFPPRDRAQFDAHWARILADKTVTLRTVVAGGWVVGNVVSWRDSERTLVGYWIGREHWGRGFATRALAAFLAEVRVRPLHAHVAEHNVGSIRVLEKCGFRRCAGEEQKIDGVHDLVFELGWTAAPTSA